MLKKIETIVERKYSKLIFFEDEEIKDDFIINIKYAPIQKEKPMVIYIEDDFLEAIDENKIDKSYLSQIGIINDNYCNLMIILSIINELLKSFKEEYLNKKLNELLIQNKCNTITSFKTFLEEILNTYKKEYPKIINDLENGNNIDTSFMKSTPICAILINNFINNIRVLLKYKENFSIMIDIKKEVPKYIAFAINKLIAIRNSNFNINILLSPNIKWPTYNTNINDVIIELNHDYIIENFKKRKIDKIIEELYQIPDYYPIIDNRIQKFIDENYKEFISIHILFKKMLREQRTTYKTDIDISKEINEIYKIISSLEEKYPQNTFVEYIKACIEIINARMTSVSTHHEIAHIKQILTTPYILTEEKKLESPKVLSTRVLKPLVRKKIVRSKI